jgi:hypothetical protein
MNLRPANRVARGATSVPGETKGRAARCRAGGVGPTAATFTICRDAPVGSQERVVTVTGTGIAYVTTTETGTCS